MAQNIVRIPTDYFGEFAKSRAIFNGSIYVGEPDTDPEILANRKTVTLTQEDGTQVPIAPEGQPLLTGSGGYITYQGSPVSASTVGDYSIKILDKQGSQVYYFANVQDASNIGTDSITHEEGGEQYNLETYLQNRFVYNLLDHGGVADNSTDNTAALNTLLTEIQANDPEEGPEIEIPRYCNFNLTQLVFGKRQTLLYWIDDDKSQTQSSTKATSERVRFIANANNFGIVNEEQVVGTLYPGHVVSVRKDVPGHDAYLGDDPLTGNTQSRLEPARAGYVIRDEQQTMFRWVYENWALSDQIFAGTRFEGFRYKITITGVGSSSFTTVPTPGTRINGINTGSHGILLSIDTNSMELLWTYREFEVGERLNDGDETTTDVIATIVVQYEPYQALRCGRKNGNWTVGLPANNDFLAPYLWGIGGKSICSVPRTASQLIPPEMSLTETGYCWADNLELPTPNGFEVVYDTAVAIASRRLELKKLGQSEAIGHVGACRAHCAFTDGGITIGDPVPINFGAFNVGLITKNATGTYTIDWDEDFVRPDYSIQLTTSNPLEYATVFNKQAATCSIRVHTTGTSTLVDLTAVLNVACFGGDI